MFSGGFWSFPTRRKRSAARFDVFRGLGAAAGRLRPPAKYFWYPASLAGVPDASEGGTNIHDKVFPAHPAYLCRRLSGIWMRGELSDTMSDYYLLLRDYSNYYL